MHKRSSQLMLMALALFGAVATGGAQQQSRNTRITYYDHTGQWVMGQVSGRTVNGISVESSNFDPYSGLEVSRSQFGMLRSRLAYNADGTLASTADPAGNKTLFSNWKRGVPQSVTHPDGKSKTAVVSDQGWITQVTDENGNSTGYGYDPMGRISSVTPPAEDTVGWNSTIQVFEQVASDEHGIPGGHWRQTITTGNAVEVIYFDALWRPLIVWEYDVARIPETQNYVRFSYDSAGRTLFKSYPSSTPNSTSGVWTEYDALGRATSVSQDSEQGVLVTVTAYGSDALGPFELVTGPDNLQTQTWYQAFSAPAYDSPIRVQRADGSVTTISRDVFGKPQSISR